jgi:hypothetical protein
MKGVVLHKRVMLDWIRHCAEQSLACPTNDEICARFNFNSPASATRLVQEIEADGAIRVERLHRARIVTITATGEATAAPAKSFKARRKAAAPTPHVPPPAAIKPRVPAAVAAAAAIDGRPLIVFAEALLMMGLECWRDDRRVDGEPIDTVSAERTR